MAVRRLVSLERKFAKDQALADRVRDKIHEYERKGCAPKATQAELDSCDRDRLWFLPLGVVQHPRKQKVRLIWDAKATVNGVSFNSRLLKGPDLLIPLPTVLSSFRQFPIAVCGDIREMFHQVQIREQDRLSQCFLWRDKPADDIQVFVMDVATFGSTCSPVSAQFVKNLNAEQFSAVYPRATKAITKNHYVDDYLDSFETAKEAIEVVKQVKLVHSKGGFDIRNFLSNSAEVLQEIGTTSKDANKELALERGENMESVLGMMWQPNDDCFTYTLALRGDLRSALREDYVPTKREVLKVVMSLFDPLGLISFFLIHGKIIIQGIWSSGTGWDETINENSARQWRQWVQCFDQLSKLRIPRCYFLVPSLRNLSGRLEVHVFVDASESAYCCVVYFRLICGSNVQLALVGAKSKVAPLKTLSIPRLELKAAVLGVQYLQTVLENHELSISHKYMWTDSTTVLAWILSNHRRYQKFVAVRVGEILTLSDPQDWRWVPTKFNVADKATKWGQGPDFQATSQWFCGPTFLHQREDQWPVRRHINTTEEELRPVHTHWLTTQVIDVARFSKWERILHSVAYVQRYLEKLQSKRQNLRIKLGALNQGELKRAEETLWKIVQAKSYPDEISVLLPSQGLPESRHPCVSKSSPIYKLWPFVDACGVLRMRSRIGAAAYAVDEAKYPAILHRQHPITKLIVNWYHRRFRHANKETVVNEIRQRFEIAKLRAVVEKVSKDCMMCRVRKAVPKPPVMAPLPSARLQPFVKPFTYAGVDYFGPILVKVGRSLVKRWVAVFTCLTIRAVHIELVHNLSTESCIMAVRRFVARRGPPAEVYSDNGTCFQGASKELQRQTNKALASTFTSAQTKWLFIPPAAPHMGGAWERLVRSVKVAIGAVTDSPKRPDDETLETILTEAEFSPSQTLIWVKEYSPVIARRTKWFEEVRELNVGDLVLLIGGTSRNQWIRGRVEQTIPGRDGRVRQAIVRTASGVLRRPAIKLAILDVLEESKPALVPDGMDPYQGLREGGCHDETPCSASTVADQRDGQQRSTTDD
ncbi:uncharacterized protein LOC134222769 [Armigeres subalbatus]|uniref:uncharacterized protein LOC134222769 n=1 Tax=Armigeres subalbatus TaxID=124917 RepID=UPI002ED22E92